MPISTENSGALMGKAQAGGGKRKVRIKKACKVFSLGRNTTVGEIVEVSEADARFLVNNRYAERVQPVEEVEEVEEVTAEDVSFEPEVSEVEPPATAGGTDEGDEEVADEDEPQRRFPGRRRRG